METYLFWGLIGVAAWYLGIPLLIKNSLRINSRPALTPVSPTNLPDDVQDYFKETAPALSSLGFAMSASFIMEGSIPNVTPHVQLWINRMTGQAAAVSAVICKQGDRPPSIKKNVEFLTKLSSGKAIATNNSSELGAFKPTDACDTLYAARLADIKNLYRLHAWRDAKILGSTATRFLPAPGAEMNWFGEANAESIDRQVSTGYLQQDPSNPEIYTPTMTGAYMMTWSQQWPMKGMKRSSEDKRADAQIRECAAAGTMPPMTNVRITSDGPPPTRKAA
jgi:hypothetical protein